MPDLASQLFGIVLLAVLAVANATDQAVAAIIVFGVGTIVGCAIVILADFYSRRRHGR